jgi:cysteine desulfurase
MLYFDHNATSPGRAEALEVAAAVEREVFGNPSSQHGPGRRARALLEESREALAASWGARPAEIVFTSGGTEANRLAIEGALEGILAAAGRDGARAPHGVVSAIEHPSVLEVHARLARRGLLTTTLVAAREDGRVPAAEIAAAFRPETRLVSLQLVNNETGVVQEVAETAAACRDRRGSLARGEPFFLHVDAVQALGKMPLRAGELGADLVTVSSHKVGGPKGAGALWARSGAGYLAPLAGGPQERRLRPGTENLPAIAGFVRAVELAGAELAAGAERQSGAAHAGEMLRALLTDRIEGAILNGGAGRSRPGTVNVSFAGVPAEILVIRLDGEGVAISTGSACASGSREPSHVLRAMGLPGERVRSAVRFSTGWSTTAAEVEAVVPIVERVVAEIRASLR